MNRKEVENSGIKVLEGIIVWAKSLVRTCKGVEIDRKERKVNSGRGAE